MTQYINWKILGKYLKNLSIISIWFDRLINIEINIDKNREHWVWDLQELFILSFKFSGDTELLKGKVYEI